MARASFERAEGTESAGDGAPATGGPDQARLPAFWITLALQAAAALVFGLAPLVAKEAYAAALGFSGDDRLVYSLGGAATTGYFIAAVVALVRRASWRELAIPAIATLTFSVGALGASVIELVSGAPQPVVLFVVVAGAVFSAIAAYWIARDQAPPIDPGKRLSSAARVVIALAVVSAGTFGLLPLFAPDPFAALFGLQGTDRWVFRLAGAGCLGYATAGIASLMAPGYRLFRIQNLAAITFNGLAAVVAWAAVLGGQGGLLAPVVAVAATFFALALTWIDLTHRSPRADANR